MDEPRTAAGRALLDELTDTVVAGGSVREYVAAIEREAAEAARAEVAEPPREMTSSEVAAHLAVCPGCGRAEVSEPGDGLDVDALLEAAHGIIDFAEATYIARGYRHPAATAGREPLDALAATALAPSDRDDMTPAEYAAFVRGWQERDIAIRAALDTPDPGAP